MERYREVADPDSRDEQASYWALVGRLSLAMGLPTQAVKALDREVELNGYFYELSDHLPMDRSASSRRSIWWRVLPPGALPSVGLLSFFYDAVSQQAWGFRPGDAESWSVVYVEDAGSCVRRPWPEELAEEGRFSPLGVRHVAELTYPAGESFDIEKLGIDRPWETYERVLGHPDDGDDDDVVTRVGGNPDLVQGDMQVECQLASNGIDCGGADYLELAEAKRLLPGASDWHLLFQIDSYEQDAGMMWGDVGKLYFWIRDEDLANRNWKAPWMVLQSG